ncbi:hypothetical protein SAMN05444920_105339 [Nonomuraea solani]|uniref:Uncharacterized protein n=1 Tax=Nonomuraea solani TaxID=1144553 RepID=A0A1H6DGD8_9ACTN|nr:hypothetical protein SAMN05444920_105339 [Nonomuraea solani]
MATRPLRRCYRLHPRRRSTLHRAPHRHGRPRRALRPAGPPHPAWASSSAWPFAPTDGPRPHGWPSLPRAALTRTAPRPRGPASPARAASPAHVTGTWRPHMAPAHGARTWRPHMAPAHGARTCDSHLSPTQVAPSALVRTGHGQGTWRFFPSMVIEPMFVDQVDTERDRNYVRPSDGGARGSASRGPGRGPFASPSDARDRAPRAKGASSSSAETSGRVLAGRGEGKLLVRPARRKCRWGLRLLASPVETPAAAHDSRGGTQDGTTA